MESIERNTRKCTIVFLYGELEEIMYVELPKRQREKEVKWSTDVYTDICTAIWYYFRESEKIMEGRCHGDLEAIRQLELKRTIEQNPGAQDPDTGVS